jgi:cellobiose-specific phosphotransferase system component IIA
MLSNEINSNLFRSFQRLSVRIQSDGNGLQLNSNRSKSSFQAEEPPAASIAERDRIEIDRRSEQRQEINNAITTAQARFQSDTVEKELKFLAMNLATQIEGFGKQLSDFSDFGGSLEELEKSMEAIDSPKAQDLEGFMKTQLSGFKERVTIKLDSGTANAITQSLAQSLNANELVKNQASEAEIMKQITDAVRGTRVSNVDVADFTESKIGFRNTNSPPSDNGDSTASTGNSGGSGTSSGGSSDSTGNADHSTNTGSSDGSNGAGSTDGTTGTDNSGTGESAPGTGSSQDTSTGTTTVTLSDTQISDMSKRIDNEVRNLDRYDRWVDTSAGRAATAEAMDEMQAAITALEEGDYEAFDNLLASAASKLDSAREGDRGLSRTALDSAISTIETLRAELSAATSTDSTAPADDSNAVASSPSGPSSETIDNTISAIEAAASAVQSKLTVIDTSYGRSRAGSALEKMDQAVSAMQSGNLSEASTLLEKAKTGLKQAAFWDRGSSRDALDNAIDAIDTALYDLGPSTVDSETISNSSSTNRFSSWGKWAALANWASSRDWGSW